MRKTWKTMIMASVMAASLVGCASNPEQSVVKEKNLDKVLEQAENTEDGAVAYEDVEKEIENYDTYETHIQDDDLHVTVDVNAKVEIPKVDQLSVYRVSQKELSEELLHKVQEVLTPGIQLYDGNVAEQDTKADIAKQIQNTKQMMADLKVGKDAIPDEETLAQYKEEYQNELTQAEQAYEKAPDKLTITDYPSDNTLHSVEKLADANPDDNFYQWEKDLNPTGEIYYGVNDGANDTYISVYMQNNENYGNCIRYCKNKNMYDSQAKVVLTSPGAHDAIAYEKGKEPDWAQVMGDTSGITPTKKETCNLSQKDAKKQADELIDKLGLGDFECTEEDYCAQMYSPLKGDDTREYRSFYQFIYLRNLDGVIVDNTAGQKLVDEWRGDDYVKKMWDSEAIAVAVNDEGIVEFQYGAPISIDETVVAQSNIKSFEEIKNTFEEMVVIENAPTEDTGKTVIDVTNVNLVYTRISEKDRFDTGLIVPVWDFEGTIVNEYGMEQTGNILSINAIDGTVINRTLGY